MGPVPRMQMVATGSRGSCGRETDTSACLPILGHTLVGAAYMPARSARSRRLSAMWALALLAVCPAGTRDLTARIRQTAAPTATAPPSSTAASDIVRTYCVTCHNGTAENGRSAARRPGRRVTSPTTRSSGKRSPRSFAPARCRLRVGRGRMPATYARSRRHWNASWTRRRRRIRIQAACLSIA